jgi:hypothetical protein
MNSKKISTHARGYDENMTYREAIRQFGLTQAYDYLVMIEKMADTLGKNDLRSYEERWILAFEALDAKDQARAAGDKPKT